MHTPIAGIAMLPGDFLYRPTGYARELVGWKGTVSLVGIWQGTRTGVGLNVTRLINKNECQPAGLNLHWDFRVQGDG